MSVTKNGAIKKEGLVASCWQTSWQVNQSLPSTPAGWTQIEARNDKVNTTTSRSEIAVDLLEIPKKAKHARIFESKISELKGGSFTWHNYII